MTTLAPASRGRIVGGLARAAATQHAREIARGDRPSLAEEHVYLAHASTSTQDIARLMREPRS